MADLGLDIAQHLAAAAKAGGKTARDLQRLLSDEVDPDPCVLEGTTPRTHTVGGVIVAEAPATQTDGRGRSLPCVRCGGTTYESVPDRVRECRPCPGHAVHAAAQRLTGARIPGRYLGALTTHVAQATEAVSVWRLGAPGLWLWGDTGAGKSHAAARSLRALVTSRGAVGRWVDVTDLLDEVRDTYRGADVSEADVLRRLASVPVLVLDELGVQRGTRRLEFEATVVGALVQRRYSAGGLTTWVTSNASPEELAAAHDWQMDRTVSRLCEMTIRVHVRGGDRRRAHG